MSPASGQESGIASQPTSEVGELEFSLVLPSLLGNHLTFFCKMGILLATFPCFQEGFPRYCYTHSVKCPRTWFLSRVKNENGGNLLIPEVVLNPSPCSWVSGAALVLSLRQLSLSQQTERSLLKGYVIGGPKSWNLFLLNVVTGALPLDTRFLALWKQLQIQSLGRKLWAVSPTLHFHLAQQED